MPRFIVHHDGRFFEWSTVSDAPTTFGMSREEFLVLWREEEGQRGMVNIDARLDRAVKNGTSQLDGESAEDAILFNRAGPDETELSFDDVIRFYVVEKALPWAPDWPADRSR